MQHATPMRIALDGNIILERQDGVSRYTYNLAQALASTVMAQDELYVLYEPGASLEHQRLERLAKLPGIRLRPAPELAGATASLNLSRTLKSVGAEVYHSPYNFFGGFTNLPTVVTLHELGMADAGGTRPGGWIGRLSQFTQQAQLALLRRADAIICVSESLRRDLLGLIDLNPTKIHVIYNGVDHSHFHPRYRPEARQRAAHLLGIEPPYILALASDEPRKNLRTLLHAYARLPEETPKLVLAGAGKWGRGPIYDMVKEAGIEARVRFTGYVPESILPDLYSGARCFVFPSLYEGFGLPVLEAMSCGAPVVTGNRTSLPEVAGSGAVLVDPTNVAQMAEAMNRIVSNKAFRDDLRAKALGQASQFSWERTATKTREVYEAVIPKAITPS